MADFGNIRRLAEARAGAGLYLQNLGVMSVPHDLEKRIAQDAQYQIASDAFNAADAAYRAAIGNLSADELSELARGAA